MAVPRPRPELLLVLVVAAVLNLWSLDTNGYANAYYSAAVRSMSGSWHAFLYGSFDSAGGMTVDKPPLALWVQSLSARAFGLSSWSILVPQAVMGVVTVALAYDLARRRFGRRAGFVAGLVLALTPVSVAVWRDNNTDALLILCCVAAVWFAARGLEDGRTRWLVLSGVAVGLGFETKMAAALLVVPALAAAWLWVAPRGTGATVRSLVAGGVAMVVVGIAWPLLVALTPVADRPWISGTDDNSIWSLVLGYNGAGRLLGQAGGPGALGVHRGPFGGDSGPLRLLDPSLGGQAGWLVGFALVAGIGIALSSRVRRGDARTGWIIAVGGSFATIAVAFSAAHGIFHPYYVSLLAPFTALLVGAGVAFAWGAGPLARVTAPLALAAGVAFTVAILKRHPGELDWLPAVLVVGAAGAALALAMAERGWIRMLVLAGGVGLLLIAPTVWSVDTVGHAVNGTFPVGGPAPRPTATLAPHRVRRRSADRHLHAALAYVRRHGGGTLAVSRQGGLTAQVIVQTGADLAGIGGFSGRESQVTIPWFANAVRRGRIAWVLVGGPPRCGGPDGRIGSGTVMWAARRAGVKTRLRGLYRISGRAHALRALRPPACAGLPYIRSRTGGHARRPPGVAMRRSGAAGAVPSARRPTRRGTPRPTPAVRPGRQPRLARPPR
jgi:4-amino-4-deoxy-L-arabinose transferase-like glycosyltransferase